MCAVILSQVQQWQRLKMMVTSAGNRKAILLCLGLYFCSVVTGYNVVNYHAKTILTQAKVSMERDLSKNYTAAHDNVFFICVAGFQLGHGYHRSVPDGGQHRQCLHCRQDGPKNSALHLERFLVCLADRARTLLLLRQV